MIVTLIISWIVCVYDTFKGYIDNLVSILSNFTCACEHTHTLYCCSFFFMSLYSSLIFSLYILTPAVMSSQECVLLCLVIRLSCVTVVTMCCRLVLCEYRCWLALIIYCQVLLALAPKAFFTSHNTVLAYLLCCSIIFVFVLFP